MTEPMRLIFPENAQINVYVIASPPASRGVAASTEDEQFHKPRQLLRPVVLGLLVFGLGYAVHGVTGQLASAEGDPPTRPDFPVMPAPPGPPPSMVGPRQGTTLAPGIHVGPPQPPGSPAGGPPASILRPVPPTPPAPAARNPFGLD
jgi:hypothetical protein